MNRSETMKLLWKDKKYRKAQIKAQNRGKKEADSGSNISLTMREQYASGQRKVIGGTEWIVLHTDKAGKISCHDRHCEAYVAKLLDNNSNVKVFKKDWPRIGYKNKGKDHTYFPDYYIRLHTGRRVLLELLFKDGKGGERKYIRKVKAAKRYCKRRGWKFVFFLFTRKDVGNKIVFKRTVKRLVRDLCHE